MKKLLINTVQVETKVCTCDLCKEEGECFIIPKEYWTDDIVEVESGMFGDKVKMEIRKNIIKTRICRNCIKQLNEYK